MRLSASTKLMTNIRSTCPSPKRFITFYTNGFRQLLKCDYCLINSTNHTDTLDKPLRFQTPTRYNHCSPFVHIHWFLNYKTTSRNKLDRPRWLAEYLYKCSKQGHNYLNMQKRIWPTEKNKLVFSWSYFEFSIRLALLLPTSLISSFSLASRTRLTEPK